MRSRTPAALFFIVFIAAKLDAGAALSFSVREPGVLQIVSPVLDVRPQLIFHVFFQATAMENSVGQGTKPAQQFHLSSGCAARAAAMAVAKRFQLSASSRRRLRPAVVSS